MSGGVAPARRVFCWIGSLVRRIVVANAAPSVAAMVSILLSATSVRAEEIVVPDDYFTVAAAVAAAQDGDVVLVRPGDYLGTVDFAGKAITVRSTDGPEKTTLDAANYDNSVVVFANGEGRASVLEGFELRNGTGNCDLFFCYGGGVFCNETSPTIRNCIIRDNETAFDGGGLYARRGSPLIEDCVFEGNVASWYRGGAMYVIDSPAIVIRRTEFRDNYGDDGGGGILAKETDLVLEDCSFIGNVTTGPGGGVSVESGTAIIRRCVFDSNVCGGRGGGFAFSGTTLELDTAEFAFNDAGGDGGGLDIRCTAASVEFADFIDNRAYGKGGGIHADQGDSLRIVGCRFERNTADVSDGGGLRTGGIPTEIRHCIFTDNAAEVGGGVYADQGTALVIVGSRFTRNIARNGVGGGLEADRLPVDIVNTGFFQNRCTDAGGGARIRGGDVVVANCVFAGNFAYWRGGALDVHEVDHRVVNCTIVDNESYETAGGICVNPAGLVANSIVRGNHAARWPDIANRNETWISDLRWANVSVWEGEVPGRFDGPAGIVDRRGPDRVGGTGDEDYRATGCLLGIDAGDATLVPADRADVDFDGDLTEAIPLDYFGLPRFVDDPSVPDGPELPGGAVDLGASEWNLRGVTCAQDLDCDGNGVADALDIAACDGDPGCLDCNGNGRPDRCDLIDRSGPFFPAVGYWRFEEDGTNLGFSDLQGDLQGDSGVVVDVGVDAVPGILGAVNRGSLEIGDTGFVRVRDPDQRFAMGRGSFTIEAWVRLDELGAMGDPGRRQYLVQRKPGDSGGSRMDYAFLVQGGNLPTGVDRRYGKPSGLSGREMVLQFGDGADTWCVTSYLEIEATGWHHVSAAIDARSATVRFGIDGRFETIEYEGSDVDRYASQGNLILGAHTNSSGQFNQRLRGAIDEVRIIRGVIPVDALLDVWPVGSSADCNGNGLPDDCDIRDGLLIDADGDGIPDDCVVAASCPADLDGDGVVGGGDLGQLFLDWGVDGPADLDGDGVVGGGDLGLLFLGWGDCPPGCDSDDCDDDDECTLEGCHPVTGACTHFRLPGCITDPCFGDPCDDGDDCTVDECDPITGGCTNLPIPGCSPDPCEGVRCDDGNPCTDDFCDPVTGDCRFELIEGCENAPCGDPAAGDCFEPSPVPSCDDLDCCDAVCDVDQFCCDVVWDLDCVELAENLCSGP